MRYTVQCQYRLSMQYAPRILVVDDEPSVRNLFAAILLEDGYTVTAVGTVREALWRVGEAFFDVVILDLSLPDASGLEAIGQLHAECPGLKILATSGFMSGPMPALATSSGAAGVLKKPTTPDLLRVAVYRLLDETNSWLSGR